MELKEAISTRRSVRKYKSQPVPEQDIRELLALAAMAPSGMNSQPWLFAVIEDREYLKELSGRSKALMLKRLQAAPHMDRYRGLLYNPDFNIFYDAPALVLIYGDKNAITYIYDCSLAAQNLMLAAWDRGIGSCWIGFATFAGNSPEVKSELNIPGGYELVAPVILGYPENQVGQVKRNELKIASWKK